MCYIKRGRNNKLKNIKEIFEGIKINHEDLQEIIPASKDDGYEEIKKKLLKKYKVLSEKQLGRFEQQKFQDELDKAWKYGGGRFGRL